MGNRLGVLFHKVVFFPHLQQVLFYGTCVGRNGIKECSAKHSSKHDITL